MLTVNRWACAVVAVLFPAVSASSATAAVVYDSEGFETPPFINNTSLVDQDPDDGPWAMIGGGLSTAIIQSDVAASGSQSVQVTRSGDADADEWWWVENPITPAERFVIVEWDQRTLQTSQGGVDFGPLFGIEAYDYDAIGDAVLLAGSALVDSTTGDLMYVYQER